jgi:hypothetical protein
MKDKCKVVAVFFFAISLLVSGCGSGQVFGPTRTATSTKTLAPTNTPTLTFTPTLTNTSTPTITPTPTSIPRLPLSAGTPLPQLPEKIEPENANQIVEIAHWGFGQIGELAWSPKGNLLAVATSLGVYLYEAQTFRIIDFLESKTGVNSIAFSPDGQILAIGSGLPGHIIQIWNVESSEVQDLEIEDASSHLCFSSDGRSLAYGVGKDIVIRKMDTG